MFYSRILRYGLALALGALAAPRAFGQATPPSLTSATPGIAAAGATQVRLTLIGSGFRPGATIVVSPPLASLSGSTGSAQAADVTVDDVVIVSGGLIVATIDVGADAVAGLRAVDVRNTDGTSTALAAL